MPVSSNIVKIPLHMKIIQSSNCIIESNETCHMVTATSSPATVSTLDFRIKLPYIYNFDNRWTFKRS